jgi:S-formylglutathione hydrolase FrmB
VLLAFPGFSGWHAGGDAWVAREIFARAAEAHGMELIIVGIGTRTAEGTSYLQRSERFGDWDGYVSERLIAELDTRFRTNGRRAAAGHSTGGWNALAFALHHPDLVDAVGASSPDPPDLDAWLLDDAGRVRPEWMGWMRAEAALGGRGQFVSWAAAWSPDDSERGFAWPVELASGALRPEVYARWQEASLASFVRTPAGRRAARKLSGAIAITAGQSDEFALFEPSERFVATLGQAEVDVRWTPTELGHFGHEERFEPLAQLIAERLGASAD